MEAIRTAIAGAPLRWCIVSCGLLAFAVQAWLMVAAWQRRVRQGRLRAAAVHGPGGGGGAAPVPGARVGMVALLAVLTTRAAPVAAGERARTQGKAGTAGATPADRAAVVLQG